MNISYDQTCVGLEPTKFLRAEIEKHFVRFLVEMKTVAFEIIRPLLKIKKVFSLNAELTFSHLPSSNNAFIPQSTPR